MEEQSRPMSTIEKAAAKLATRGKSALQSGMSSAADAQAPITVQAPAIPTKPTIMQGKAQGFLDAAEHFSWVNR